ncbi:MAG: tRNA glutamyl-Q(34) synthetase GluQRS [Pseudomonadota bacterium]
MANSADTPVFRFAPSPNGKLHLGHALSALLCHDRARAMGGRFLIRFEDIDTVRCSRDLAEAMLEDLAWLGLTWDAEPEFQSDHFQGYRAAAERLRADGLLYPCTCSRGEIARAIADDPAWPRDPDGAPLYPGTHRPRDDEPPMLPLSGQIAWRLDMARALRHAGQAANVTWFEDGQTVTGDPAVWGDAVLIRKDTPASYHLACVLDDARQGVTHVVRGEDLKPATSLHGLLQICLDLPAPAYHHHRLVLDKTGRKLSKSDGDTSLADLRRTGATPSDIRKSLGL